MIPDKKQKNKLIQSGLGILALSFAARVIYTISNIASGAEVSLEAFSKGDNYLYVIMSLGFIVLFFALCKKAVIFFRVPSKKVSAPVKTYSPKTYSKPAQRQIRCTRCRKVLSNQGISSGEYEHMCTECANEKELLNKQLAEAEETVSRVIAKGYSDMSDDSVASIKNKAEAFLERYIKDTRSSYTFYYFSPHGGSSSYKDFSKDKDGWYVLRYSEKEEPSKTVIRCTEIHSGNFLEKFVELLAEDKKQSEKNTFLSYEEERTDKKGRVYLGSVGEWGFSEYYYDKAKHELIREKYHEEYLDTGTVFEGSSVISLQQMRADYAKAKRSDDFEKLSGYLKSFTVSDSSDSRSAE